MKHSMLKFGMVAGLVNGCGSRVAMPTLVLAQADIWQEDRQADRQAVSAGSPQGPASGSSR